MSRLVAKMPCCGRTEPITPIVRDGLPTVWAYLPPVHGLAPVAPNDLDAVFNVLDAREG